MARKKPEPKMITLNEEQRAVVESRSGTYAVLAGPGSGKSRCATMRYAELIREGVSADEILSLSFTQTAAKNLKDRVEELTGKLSISRTAGSMTLHGLALRFCTEEKESFSFELADFPLATEPVANRMSAQSATKFGIDPRALRTAVSLFKRNRIRPKEALKNAENALKATEIKAAMAYADYEKRMKSEKVLDFDSLMFEMVDLMTKNKEVRGRWQYQYVICDESQDCCLLDWQLLKLLSEEHGNLLCVGDPGQNIYSFRGSDSSLFLGMDKMFPTVQKLYLATNYRSTPELVSFLKGIGPVPDLAEKFVSFNPSGPVPIIKGFASPALEADFVVRCIQEAK